MVVPQILEEDAKCVFSPNLQYMPVTKTRIFCNGIFLAK